MRTLTMIRLQLSAEGLIINGYLECTMVHHQRHLTVSKNARVEADLHASTVVVFGQLIGDIVSEGKVLLAKGSDVRGDISCAGLYIEEGAQFKGQIAMSADATDANVGYS